MTDGGYQSDSATVFLVSRDLSRVTGNRINRLWVLQSYPFFIIPTNHSLRPSSLRFVSPAFSAVSYLLSSCRAIVQPRNAEEGGFLTPSERVTVGSFSPFLVTWPRRRGRGLGWR